MSPEAEKILKSIFSFGTSEDSFPFGGVQCQSPGAGALFSLCELLATNPAEEALHAFLCRYPGFLLGMFGTNDGGDLAFISKPRIGTRFVGDFVIVQVFQGGATIRLIEIETSHARLFTNDLRPAERLQIAMKQLDEWREWIEPNKLSFVRSIIDTACDAPLYSPDCEDQKSCRFMTPDEVRGLWNAFRGFEHPYLNYSAIIGRWSQLIPKEKERFLSKFGRYGDVILTFDQLARRAIYRPTRQEL